MVQRNTKLQIQSAPKHRGLNTSLCLYVRLSLTHLVRKLSSSLQGLYSYSGWNTWRDNCGWGCTVFWTECDEWRWWRPSSLDVLHILQLHTIAADMKWMVVWCLIILDKAALLLVFSLQSQIPDFNLVSKMFFVLISLGFFFCSREAFRVSATLAAANWNLNIEEETIWQK